jgi:hypothetical protein
MPRLPSKNLVKVGLLAATLLLAAACLQQAARTPPTITGAATPDPVPLRTSSKTFEKFSHQIAEHKQFNCVSCHRREGKQRELEYTGHESCVGCHMNQFTQASAEESPPMCFVCHDKLNVSPPTMQSFPTKFIEGFNMKFDHQAHDSGAGRPARGCAACHSPSGAGQTIQTGIDTHATCYACHTPESKIGSCVTCHELGPYRRITQASYGGFPATFSHRDHTAAQRVSCEECHNVQPGPPGKQVTSIAILEHRTTPGNNCLKCHNGSRAFTGNVAANPNCSRCHVGMTAPLPPGTFKDNQAPDAAAATPIP